MAKLHSTNLEFLDKDNSKDKKDNLNRSKGRTGKGDIAAHKMFGSKRKNILNGKKFRKSGKDVGKKGSISAKQQGNTKGSGVSPSMAEFDKMVGNAVKNTKGSKKSMFGRKQFD